MSKIKFKEISFWLIYLFGLTYSQTINDEFRLPQTIIPKQYKISLQTYLNEEGAQRLNFGGNVEIELEVKESTNQIMIHSKDLKYEIRQYWTKNDPQVKNLTTFDENERTSITSYQLPLTLRVGEILYLRFQYSGVLSNDMAGFYYNTYKTLQNENNRWLASTLFAANHARRAFPCLDEPSFKAVFQVNLTRPTNFNSYTNTPLLTTFNVNDKYDVDVFDVTPVMSTYLNCFLIAEFKQRSNDIYSVIARPDYFDQTKYAFETGPKSLAYMSEYFGIDYYSLGIPKVDLAAIPDFYHGAMENWGLITYKEFALLYDEFLSPLSSKQRITTIVTHEQAHLWFGDLVTCDWWSYTWLNEGFADYFEYMITHEVDPSFELDKQFVVTELQTVMDLDSRNSTNPMNYITTDTQTLINVMYNQITYNKGASFIRMVKHVLGEENFQQSMREYLQQNKYETTEPVDVFNIWTKLFPTKFKGFATDFFNSFTWQVGYPLVTVQVSQDRKSFQVTQKRFLMDPSDGSDSSLLYTTPFTYTTNLEKNFNKTSTDFFLPPSTTSTYIPLNQSIDWIIGNIQEVGFYRVNYDEETWKHIRQALTSSGWGSIHEINRAQIVDDLFNLARADEIPYSLALNILEYLENETNYLAWEAAFRGFSFLSKKLGDNLNNFSQHILKLTNNVYTSLGFVEKKDDKPLDILLRSLLIEWTCKHGSESCINTAKSYFQNMNNTHVPPNIRLPVYCVGVREGSQTEFDLLIQKYQTATVATETSLILSALGCLKDENLIKGYIDFISTDDVRLQDKSTALSSLTQYNNKNVTPVFRIVTENHVKLAAALGGYSSLASVIESIADRFTTESQLEELRSFIYQNQDNFGNLLAGTEKKVISNLKWSSERLGPVHEYLNQGVGVASTTVPLPLIALIAIFVVNKVL